MNTATNQTIDSSDIDSILDSTLDDLADVPEFKPFPIGTHRCIIKWDLKKIKEKTAVDLHLTGLETMELATPTDTPIKNGDTTNVLFILFKDDGGKNEISEGQWKECLKPLAQHFGTVSNRDTMEKSNGAECLVTTTIRTDKRDKNNLKDYTAIVSLTVI